MERRRKVSIAIATAGALAVGGLSACASTGPDSDVPTSITIAVSSIPGSWDPFQGASFASAPLMGAYEPLVYTDGTLTPAIAKSWEASEDGFSIEFTLNENVDYVDGTHLTAQTVADYLTELFLAPESAVYGNVSGPPTMTAEATGEYTVKLTARGENREFRPSLPYSFLGAIPIISPAAVADRTLLEDGPQGTGPYLVDDYQPEVSISYVRNPDYWNPDAYPFDEVTYVAYADDVAILNALKTGQVDTGVLGSDVIGEAEASGFTINTGLGSTAWMEILDMEGDIVPALADVRVRQAINMAFDRVAIGDAVNFGFGYVTSQLYTDAALEYVDGGDDRYPYDPEKARELLAEAGYPDGFDVTLPYVDSFGGDYIPIIQQAFGDIGIRVTLDTSAAGDIGKLFTELWPNSALALIYIPVVDGAEFFVPYFVGRNGTEELERLGEIVENGTDAERIEALAAAGEEMLESGRYIPLGYTPTFYVSQPEFEVTLRHPYQRGALLDGYTVKD
jgi:peptide/nickel transport system substrate-binding protein